MNYSTVIFSNDYSFLARELQEALFQDSDPLAPRYVLIPNRFAKAFLVSYFASHGIFAGIKILTLQEALEEWLLKKEAKTWHRILKKEELFILLQEALLKRAPQEAALALYLGKSQLKLSAYVKQLGEFFMLKDFYGIEAFEDPFQEKLFEEVFGTAHGISLQEAFAKLKELPFYVHFFGFSYIPKHFCDFFNKKASFYVFSPCETYWEDFFGSSEKKGMRKLLKKLQNKESTLDALESFTEDQHPLLVSCGTSARLFLKHLSLDSRQTKEHYVLAALEETALGKIQKGILLGSLYEETILFEDDCSISVHICSSYFREVEVLLDSLYLFIEKSAMTAADIVVISPYLSRYLPYIQMIFGDSTSKFGYKVFCETPNSEITLFCKTLLFSPPYRLEKEIVFELFELHSFRKKMGVNKDEIKQWKKWIESAGIRWGYDLSHRAQFDDQEQHGTWEKGFLRLYEGFAIEEENLSPLPPHELELLEQLSICIRTLHTYLTTFYSAEKNMQEWLVFFKEFMGAFLVLEDADKRILSELDNLINVAKDCEENLSFEVLKDTILSLLSSLVNGSLVSHFDNRIEFRSLSSCSVMQKKIVCLLGLDQETLSSTIKNPFLKRLPPALWKNCIPEDNDLLRFSFLESIMSAKEFLWISYTGYDTQRNSVQPAAMVLEFLGTVKDSCGADFLERILIEHKTYGFDPFYYQKETHFSSYAKKYYAIAQNRQISQLLQLEVNSQAPTIPPGLYEIEVFEVLYYLFDQKRYYDEKVIGIYNEKEVSTLPFAEELQVSSARFRKLLKQTAIMSAEKVWEQEKLAMGVPSGVFGNIAYQKFQEEAALSFWEKESVVLKLDSFCKKAILKDELFIAPALKISLSKDIQVSITGTIADIRDSTLLIFEEKNKQSSQKAMALLALLQLQGQAVTEAVFVYSNKIQEFQDGDIAFLMEILGQILLLKEGIRYS